MLTFNNRIVLMLLVFVLCQFVNSQEEAPRIAVLDFQSIGCDESLGRATSEILRTELGIIGKYRIIERAQLLKVMEEQKLQLSGVVDEETAVEIGKMLGAKMVVVGSIVRIGKTFTLNSRFIDVQTAEVRKSRNIRGNSEDEISNMCSSLAKIISGDTEMIEEPEEEDLDINAGSVWLVQESSFTAIWTRRGKSNIFDAVWYKSGDGIRADLSIVSRDEQSIVLKRVDGDNVLGMYKGTSSSEGRHYRGTATWSDKVTWTAEAFSSEPSSGITSSNLGSVWIVLESDFSGIWRRVGTTNNFEATFFPNKSAVVRAELKVENAQEGGIKIKRTEGNKVLGYYYGTFSADQKRVTGAADWSRNAVWSAELLF